MKRLKSFISYTNCIVLTKNSTNLILNSFSIEYTQLDAYKWGIKHEGQREVSDEREFYKQKKG